MNYLTTVVAGAALLALVATRAHIASQNQKLTHTISETDPERTTYKFIVVPAKDDQEYRAVLKVENADEVFETGIRMDDCSGR